MTRTQVEELIADYLDGTLDEATTLRFEEHLPLYPDLEELVLDSQEGMLALRDLDTVTPPPEFFAKLDASVAEMRRTATREKRSTGIFAAIAAFFSPMMQPRFVMGMAMTILSVSMIGQLTGTRIDQVTADDLRPSAIWSAMGYRAERAWDRATKYYESLRIVYEMRTQVQDWKVQLERDRQRAAERLDDPETELGNGAHGSAVGNGAANSGIRNGAASGIQPVVDEKSKEKTKD